MCRSKVIRATNIDAEAKSRVKTCCDVRNPNSLISELISALTDCN